MSKLLFQQQLRYSISKYCYNYNKMIVGMRVAKKTVITCDRNKAKETVLPMLRDKVFHVTSFDAYRRIVTDRVIKTNKDSGLGYSLPQSENSYGRKRGYICLFDLRNKSGEIIEEALIKFPPLNPSHQKISIFLILSQKVYPKLIYDTEVKKKAGYEEVYIPYVECWYPDNIPLKYIDEILEVRITGQDDDYNPYKRWTKEQKEHLLETMKSYDFRKIAGD